MSIIEIKKENVSVAAHTLANAFQSDPIFKFIFKSSDEYLRIAPWLFSTWIKWSILYGKAWMNEEGSAVLISRVPGRAKMSISSMVKAGLLLTPIKMKFSSFCRFFFKVVTLLDNKNSEFMGNRPHWYAWMVGISDDKPGIKAKELVDHYLRIVEQSGLPIYIETESKVHVRYYMGKGFKKVGETNISEELTIYFMVRQAT